MEIPVLQDLLRAIKDAVSGGHHKESDVALPIFDPATSDLGAESWCGNIDALANEFGWSSIATVAKAGKALKGSALLWFETWDPADGRTWENLCLELKSLYPEKKNLAEKMHKAVLYSSESADSYCEYAREKIRLLRTTKVAFTESQLIELVCGSICDVNVRMASFNSNVKSTSELISLFTSYTKIRKRPLEHNGRNSPNNNPSKRPKVDSRSNDIKCFTCGKVGHTKTQCYRNNVDKNDSQQREQKSGTFASKFCTYCKKPGHNDLICRYKPKSDSDTTEKVVNFLDQTN